MNGYRLALPGKDFPKEPEREHVDLYNWLRRERVSSRRPAIARCDKCRVYTGVWGYRIAAAFTEAHEGHGSRIELDAKGKR